MSGITVTTGPRINVDAAAVAQAIAPLAVGAIVDRTARGLDIHGRPFRTYSAEHRARLAAMGEAVDVDLRITGGLLNSVHVQRTEHSGDTVTLVIGPDSGTSPTVAPPKKGRLRAVRTGGRGPPHAVLGAWLHYGRGHLPPRPWLGLDPKARARLADEVRRIALRRSGAR